MRYALTLLAFLMFSSCIPLRIAPTIKEEKVMLAKKFKRKLPKRYAFIFEDPKDAGEFYNYINTKYGLDHQNVERNVPITVNNNTFFLSFYETEIPTKTINLIPILIDVGLTESGLDPMLEDAEFSRIGNWYIALTVSDAAMEDALHPSHGAHRKIIPYLRKLRIEYLNTTNYYDALFRN